MLAISKCWHNAPYAPPEREGRLVFFANAPEPAEDPEEPEQQPPAAPEAPDQPSKAEEGEKPKNPVTNTADHQRMVIFNAMHEPEGKADELIRRFDAANEKMRAFQQKLQQLKQRSNEPAVKKFRELNSDTWDRFMDDEHHLAGFTVEAEAGKDIMTTLRQWHRGEMSPPDLLTWLRNEMHPESPHTLEEEQRREAVGGVQEYLRRKRIREDDRPVDLRFPQSWSSLNFSAKAKVMSEINPIAGIPDKVEYLETIVSNYEQAIATSKLADELAAADSIIEELAKQKGAIPEKAPETQGSGQWFSIKQMFAGATQWVNAWGRAWTNKQEHAAAAFGKKIGSMMRWLPYGKEAEREMEQNVDEHNRKLKNAFKEFLEARKPKFEQLFDEGGILDRNVHDSNRAMAVLEYAASRGWLYRMNDDNERKNRLVFGRSFDEMVSHYEWGADQIQNTWTDLVGQNTDGETKEQGKGKNTKDKLTTTTQYLEAFNEEMKARNFWGALGVIEAFIGRGKAGEAGTMMAVAYMRWLRDDDVVRKYIPDVITERIGFPTYHRAYFTLSHLTHDKGKIREWLAANESDPKKAGTLGTAIGLIEDYIRDHTPQGMELDKKTTDDLVSRILAAQTVKIPGVYPPKYLSIFKMMRLERYRTEPDNALFTYFKNIDIQQDSIDYYTNQSEVILVPQSFINQLTSTNNAGRFESPERTQNFFGQVIYRYEELQRKGLGTAAEQFKREMSPKLQKGFAQSILGKERSKAICNVEWEWGKYSHPLIASLIKKKFLNINIVGEPEARQIVERQLLSLNGDLTQEELNFSGGPPVVMAS